MYNSISYVEIRCKYNKSDLKRFVGALQDKHASRVIMYRNRKYTIVYLPSWDEFRILNARNVLLAVIEKDLFKFYASLAPEIGLELVFGFLALFNIYPVKA